MLQKILCFLGYHSYIYICDTDSNKPCLMENTECPNKRLVCRYCGLIKYPKDKDMEKADN